MGPFLLAIGSRKWDSAWRTDSGAGDHKRQPGVGGLTRLCILGGGGGARQGRQDSGRFPDKTFP